MIEVESNSVDIIITSIPFNVGLIFGEYHDKNSLSQYSKVMKNVMAECSRVLNRNGVAIIEAADVIVCDGYFVQLAGLIQSFCIESGLFLGARHIDFMDASDYIENPIGEFGKYFNLVGADGNHSNCLQWLIFKKESCDFKNGEIYYSKYPDHRMEQLTERHPCPFPQEIIDKFLMLSNFKKGDTVLDPFMGTAKLGCHVLRRGGRYIGYEIDKKIYDYAVRQLKSL